MKRLFLLVTILCSALSAHTDQMYEKAVGPGFIEIRDASGYLPAIIESNVNVRRRPNQKSEKIGLLKGGETIQAKFLLESDWAKIVFKSQEAYVHKSALIKQLYKADIASYSYDDRESSVFSMAGWHGSYLPGSYFLTYQSNKFGYANFGPIEGSSYSGIDTKLFKIKSTETNAYLAISHRGGNRVIYLPYLAVVDDEQLTVFQLPSHNEGNPEGVFNYVLDEDYFVYSSYDYWNCCTYYRYEVKIDLRDLTFSGTRYLHDEDDITKTINEPIELIVNKIKLNKTKGL